MSTLHGAFGWQLWKIQHALNTQVVQRFTQPVNARNVLQPVPNGADPVADFRHGTVYAYERYKCRCEKCREAKSAYKRKYSTGHFVRMRHFRSQPSLFQEQGVSHG